MSRRLAEEECPHGIRRWIYCMECARVGIAIDPLRACGDCSSYTPESKMITKTDGRVICPACQKAIEAQTRERSQADLFLPVNQLYFELSHAWEV